MSREWRAGSLYEPEPDPVAAAVAVAVPFLATEVDPNPGAAAVEDVLEAIPGPPPVWSRCVVLLLPVATALLAPLVTPGFVSLDDLNEEDVIPGGGGGATCAVVG